MAYTKATINGYPAFVDDGAPTTPVTNVSQDGGDLLCTLMANLANGKRIIKFANDYQYHMVGTVIRFSTTSGQWETIETIESSGGNHFDEAVSSVTTTSTSVAVNYDTSAMGSNVRVISSSVVADETLAKRGVICGASVNSSAVTITLTTSGVGDSMAYNGAAWVSTRGYFTGTWDSGNNRAVFTGNGSPGTITGSVESTSSTYIQNVAGLVCGYDTPYLCVEEGRGTSSGDPFIRVAFYDTTTGSKVTSVDTNMKCNIWLPFASHILNPTQFVEDTSNIWVLSLLRSDL